jgi:hypothetical protein
MPAARGNCDEHRALSAKITARVSAPGERLLRAESGHELGAEWRADHCPERRRRPIARRSQHRRTETQSTRVRLRSLIGVADLLGHAASDLTSDL